jgi:hypothetical protein
MIGYTNCKTMPWRNGHNRISESVCSGRLSVTRRLHAAMPCSKEAATVRNVYRAPVARICLLTAKRKV